jgi:hypothetical protein
MALIILVGGIVKFTWARRINLPKALTAQLMIPLKQVDVLYIICRLCLSATVYNSCMEEEKKY